MHLITLRIATGFTLLICTSLAVQGDEPSERPFKSAPAIQAWKEYETRMTWARTEREQAAKDLDRKHAAKVNEVEADYTKKLKETLGIALKEEDLEEANRIDAAIKSLAAQTAAVAAERRGADD